MATTKIEWADKVWNPVTGCTKVSEGCRNCYAELMASRFWKDRKFSDVKFHPERLSQPLGWKKPARVFVNSMSDLFHPDIPFEFIDEVFYIMRVAEHHTFMVLTKRPEIMLKFLEWQKPIRWPANWVGHQPNVWLGVSVEDQKTADQRIPLLLETPAAVRFVSCEPLLGPVDLAKKLGQYSDCPECGYGVRVDEEGLCNSCGRDAIHYGIDWVIVGGESGKNARPMHPDWVRSIRDQCVDAGVPFFFKQWGEWAPVNEIGDGWYCLTHSFGNMIRTRIPNKSKIMENAWDGHLIARVGKKRAGRLLDGREWNEFPMSESQEVV